MTLFIQSDEQVYINWVVKKNISVSCDEYSSVCFICSFGEHNFLALKDFFFFTFLVFRAFALCKHRKRWCYCKKTPVLAGHVAFIQQLFVLYMPTLGVALWYELTVFSIKERRARLQLQ